MMHDPNDTVKLINRLKLRILDKGITKNKIVAEQIAREWVLKKHPLVNPTIRH